MEVTATTDGDAAGAAWLLAKHAGRDRAFQVDASSPIQKLTIEPTDCGEQMRVQVLDHGVEMGRSKLDVTPDFEGRADCSTAHHTAAFNETEELEVLVPAGRPCYGHIPAAEAQKFTPQVVGATGRVARRSDSRGPLTIQVNCCPSCYLSIRMLADDGFPPNLLAHDHNEN